MNLYLPADVDKWDLHMLHWTAWQRGLKYLRQVSTFCWASAMDRNQ
ncbi:hypothetical protein [Bradyrhizobium ottawaense]